MKLAHFLNIVFRTGNVSTTIAHNEIDISSVILHDEAMWQRTLKKITHFQFFFSKRVKCDTKSTHF